MYYIFKPFFFIDQFPSAECKAAPKGEYLFNVKDDLYEKNNVLNKYPEKVNQMREIRQKKYRDEVASENAHKKNPPSDPSKFNDAWTLWGGV